MTAQSVIVTNPAGLHARLASMFCALARRFSCGITVRASGRFFSARDILDVMAADVRPGGTVLLMCDGPDEALALETLIQFITNLTE
jgi:phosphocarrier protein HPr